MMSTFILVGPLYASPCGDPRKRKVSAVGHCEYIAERELMTTAMTTQSPLGAPVGLCHFHGVKGVVFRNADHSAVFYLNWRKIPVRVREKESREANKPDSCHRRAERSHRRRLSRGKPWRA
jgi:hypothetical protein